LGAAVKGDKRPRARPPTDSDSESDKFQSPSESEEEETEKEHEEGEKEEEKEEENEEENEQPKEPQEPHFSDISADEMEEGMVSKHCTTTSVLHIVYCRGPPLWKLAMWPGNWP
jgi:hypothetical protein